MNWFKDNKVTMFGSYHVKSYTNTTIFFNCIPSVSLYSAANSLPQSPITLIDVVIHSV